MMHSSTVETPNGSWSTATSGTGGSRLSQAFLLSPARLARRAARLPGLVLPFAGRRAPRTGLRSVHAWAAALAAGLALTLATTAAQAQSCEAPPIRSGALQNGKFCKELENCSPVDLAPRGTAGYSLGSVFSDQGNTLIYDAVIDDSSTGKMTALRALGVTPATNALNPNALFVSMKPARELFDITPGLPSTFETVLQVTATNNCDTTRVYRKYRTLWRHVDSLSIVSRGPYSTGDTIQVRVNFARAVWVLLDGTNRPRLRLDLGGSSGLKWAEYKGASIPIATPTKLLTFEYTVQSGDKSAAGVAVVRNSLESPGSSIRLGGAAFNKDQLIHVGLAPDRRHRVGSGGVAVTPSPGALVSNAGIASGTGGGRATFLIDIAQGFHTGGDSTDPGHKLTRVDLALGGGGFLHNNPSDFSVSVHEADGSNPDMAKKLGTLRPPASFIQGVNTFTVPGGIDLASDTNYFVVVDSASADAVDGWFGTSKTGEDAGKASGWSILDTVRRRPAAGGSWSTYTGGQNSMSMAIHGYVKGATVPGAPTITSVTPGAAATAAGSLTVNWSAPTDDGGSGIIDYDLRYCEGTTASACAGNWVGEGASTGVPDPAATDTSATITGLKAGTGHLVQVRAANVVGAGPWSALSDPPTVRTTNSATGSNNAPVLLNFNAHSGNTNDCTVNTGTVTDSVSAAPDSVVSGRRSLLHVTHNNTTFPPDTRKWPSVCNATSSSTDVPRFHDFDEDDLKLSVAVASVPDNVRLMNRPGEPAYPRFNAEGSRVEMRAVALGTAVDMTATVTVTDPSGASRSMNVTYQVRVFPGRGAKPRFDEAAGVLRFAQNQAGSVVLPPATGGDTSVFVGREIPNPYLYEVTGLPTGFTFDPKTRTVSKPASATTAGSWTVTYKADDADGVYSGKASPTPADLADAATQTFTIVVAPSTAAGAQPTIDLVRVVSAPTWDSANNGIFDTYVAGKRILIDVEMSEPVVVTGDWAHVKLRLDMGPDGGDRGTNRRTAKLDSILYGGRTLRFAYTVRSGPQNNACPVPSSNPQNRVLANDCDTDGIWVQTIGSDHTVVALAGASNPTIKSAATGVDADLTRTGLPTAGGELEGAERAKVNGFLTGSSGPVPETATIDGATLRVDFADQLDTSVNTGQLLYYLAVHGAGDVSGGHRNADQHPDRIWFENDGETLVLTIMNPARAGQKVRLTYSSRTLLKAAGGTRGPAPRFRDLFVTNNTTGLPSEAELLRASVQGSTLKLMFDRAMDESSVPAGNAFRVYTQDADGDTRNIGGRTVRIDGKTVAVTLAAAVRSDEAARVSYTWPASNRLREAIHLTEVLSFDRFRVETVADVTGPTLTGVAYIDLPGSLTASRAVLYFDEGLDTSSVPAAGDFELRNGSASGSVLGTSSFTVANNAVTFGFGTRPSTLWLKYTPPATGGIRDLAGNPAAKIDGETYSKGTGGKPERAPGSRLPVDGSFLKVIFGIEKSLDPTSIPDPSAFTLHDTDADPVTNPDGTQLSSSVASVQVSASTLHLRLAHPVLPCAGQTPFRVKYTKPDSGAKLRGVDGQTTSEVDTFGPFNVTNLRASNCRDGRNWLSHMTIGSVVIRANRPFATDRAPKPEWFSVTASGGPVTVTGAGVRPERRARAEAEPEPRVRRRRDGDRELPPPGGRAWPLGRGRQPAR